jgi:hypothetical protein
LRKALESRERIVGARVLSEATHIPVDSAGIRPIAFNGDGAETTPFDQGTGDCCSKCVELVRAVRRLAEQYDVRVSDALKHRIDVRRLRKLRR